MQAEARARFFIFKFKNFFNLTMGNVKQTVMSLIQQILRESVDLT